MDVGVTEGRKQQRRRRGRLGGWSRGLRSDGVDLVVDNLYVEKLGWTMAREVDSIEFAVCARTGSGCRRHFFDPMPQTVDNPHLPQPPVQVRNGLTTYYVRRRDSKLSSASFRGQIS